jgi:membrane protease YdiL (CAAX protease family)
LQDIYITIIYVVLLIPSLLVVKETRRRISDLHAGIGTLYLLPLTVVALLGYVFLVMPLLSHFPILNLSWLGYNIAAGPLAHQGLIGIIPFVPLLVYMLIHVNYFEEYYFRKSSKWVVLWGFLHLLMGVSLSAVFILLPLGFFYKYIYDKYGLNHAYALHFATNIVLIGVTICSFFFL